jgi:hypothetical protein
MRRTNCGEMRWDMIKSRALIKRVHLTPKSPATSQPRTAIKTIRAKIMHREWKIFFIFRLRTDADWLGSGSNTMKAPYKIIVVDLRRGVFVKYIYYA